MQEVVGEGSEVLQMSEGVFVEHLADYPEMELSWLQQLYEGSTQGAESTLNNVMNSMLMPSLSGLTKKVRALHPCSAGCRASASAMPRSDSVRCPWLYLASGACRCSNSPMEMQGLPGRPYLLST